MDGSTLSPELKAYLVAERKRVAHARILFIRRGERRAQDGLVAFVAHTTAAGGSLRRLDLERHDDLIGVDFETAGTPVGHPLFLVCTHGKHDRCCAKFGRPLYDAVREQLEPGWAWQATHVGGDRFAGNLVALPEGAYYGRVAPSEAWSVVEASLQRRLHLPLYRGRSCYGFAAQAAELAVREHTELLGVDEVRVLRIERDDERWRADVVAAGVVYDVEVTRAEGEPTQLTCSADRLRRPLHYVAESLRERAS